MKRVVTLLVALLVAILPALAETGAFSPFDHVCGHADGRWLCYGFPDITLYLPLEWEGRVTAEQTDDGMSFYQTASHEKYLEQGVAGGGFLFQLRADEGARYRELPAFEYLGYSRSAEQHFYLLLPSDYPAWTADADIRAEYDGMFSQIDLIVEKAVIERNMNFYTEEYQVVEDGNGLA